MTTLRRLLRIKLFALVGYAEFIERLIKVAFVCGNDFDRLDLLTLQEFSHVGLNLSGQLQGIERVSSILGVLLQPTISCFAVAIFPR